MNQYNNALHSHEEMDWEVLRFLQESNSSSSSRSNSSSSNSTNSNSTKIDDASVLRNTFIVYGIVWLILLLIFCWARRRYNKAYNIRNWVDEHKTPLAKSQHGFFFWMRKVFLVSDEKFMLECGMDAVCLVRIIAMLRKIALVCALNAIWLFPLYATSPTLTDEEPVTDKVAQLTISNVPERSLRMLGTVLASYIVFGYTMYLIFRELNRFLTMRHKFLTLPTIRNYSVFVRNVPEEFCDNAGVYMYFKECFSAENTVNEAFLRVEAPELAEWVKIRTQTQQKLEHAIALQEIKGVTPQHKEKMFGKKVNSIPTYTHDLQVLNQKISHRITEIEEAHARRFQERQNETNTLGLGDGVNHPSTNNNNIITRTAQGVRGAAKTATNAASSAVQTAGALISHGQDGNVQNGGFLTFHTLRARQSAMQIVHHQQPFKMEVTEAPDPDDVYWSNVGKKHRTIQLGKLFSLAATSAVCLLWTIPIAFFASLSSVNGLREKVPFIDDALEVAPFLEPVLKIIAPFLVVIVNSLLPTILRIFTVLEGKISNSFIDASVFSKLAYFMIIQTFFVSAISGGILDKLSDMIDNPTSIVSLLATSLPTQSTYFIQILIVYTAVSIGLEMLGIPRILFAYLRRFIGPKLTETERKRPFFILRPLDNPSSFQHSAAIAQMILYTTVLFVYAPIAPLTSIILTFLLWYVETIYRHQFIYIYPKSPDSGGMFWMNFIRLIFVCIYIAEVTIAGLMALKKGTVSVPLMVPLIIVTVLFNAYINQQHFRVMTYLSSHECLQVDKARGNGFNLGFLDGVFTQPEMREKYVYPENLSEERLVASGLRPDEEVIEFAGPTTSESSGSSTDANNTLENAALHKDGRRKKRDHEHRSRSSSRNKKTTYGTN